VEPGKIETPEVEPWAGNRMLGGLDSEPLKSLRRGMLGLVGLGTAGAIVELVALEHYTDWNQLIPLVVAAIGLLSGTWMALAPGLAALRVWQFTMLLFVGTGITGITMHYDVASDTVDPPILAPGLFVQLGLLGLLYTFRHPAAREES
jgi:hypothetical protein